MCSVSAEHGSLSRHFPGQQSWLRPAQPCEEEHQHKRRPGLQETHQRRPEAAGDTPEEARGRG